MKLSKAFLFLFFIFHYSLFTAAQPQDSLYSIWQDSTQSDTVRVSAYNKYIWNRYLFSKPDSAVVLAEALHSYANKYNYPKAAANGYNLQGVANGLKGNLSRALDYFKKSLAMNEEIGDERGIASNLVNIGGIYYNQGNYPSAVEYTEKSLAIEERLGNKLGIANCLVNIGLIYSDQGNYQSAVEYTEKSLAINEEIGDKWGIASNLVNIGGVYKKQGKYPRALEYFEKSLAIYEEIGNKYGIAEIHGKIGIVYQKQGNSQLALDYCRKGLAMAEEIGVLETQKSTCQCLYDTYKAMGIVNEALLYLEKMKVITDSLHTQETTKKLEQMEFAKVILQDSIAKAEEARLVKEAHQAEVRQKNRTRNVFIGSSLLLLLLAGGFYSRWRYVRKSRDIISKEKDRSENLLLNILPAEIAQELKQKGRADARDFDTVSILFTDFKGFTETSVRLSASELVYEINACFEAFDGIIEKYGVEKIKTIGDSYMAAGGLPIPTDDFVKNTVLVALEMQDFIQRRKAENEAARKPAFEMRVGIHTGPVVAGIVGVKKFQYDVWGDTVNTASRMEGNGEVGKVNISQSTYEHIRNDPQFRFERRGKVEAKGKGLVEMYFVSVKS